MTQVQITIPTRYSASTFHGVTVVGILFNIMVELKFKKINK